MKSAVCLVYSPAAHQCESKQKRRMLNEVTLKTDILL